MVPLMWLDLVFLAMLTILLRHRVLLCPSKYTLFQVTFLILVPVITLLLYPIPNLFLSFLLYLLFSLLFHFSFSSFLHCAHVCSSFGWHGQDCYKICWEWTRFQAERGLLCWNIWCVQLHANVHYTCMGWMSFYYVGGLMVVLPKDKAHSFCEEIKVKGSLHVTVHVAFIAFSTLSIYFGVSKTFSSYREKMGVLHGSLLMLLPVCWHTYSNHYYMLNYCLSNTCR